jgi:hypothetical protein
MPFIQIRSLPFAEPKPISDILCRINRDFATRLDVPLEQIHSTWEFFLPGHFAKGDMAPKCQPDSFHSLLVELLTPDFNDSHTCEMMLQILAESLAKHARVPLTKIFIQHRQACSGMVFDAGEIMRW